MNKVFMIAVVWLAISPLAHADVCGIVSQDQAEKSISFLTPGTELTMTFNQTSKITVSKVMLSKAATINGVDYYSLLVQNSIGTVVQLDPRHTNITLNPNVSINLGRLVGCGNASDPDVIVGTPIAPYLMFTR